MKKFLCLILVVLLVFSFSACQKNASNNNDNSVIDSVINENDNSSSANDNTQNSKNDNTDNNDKNEQNSESDNQKETAYSKTLKILGNPETTRVIGHDTMPNNHIFRINETGTRVRYIEIEALKEGKPVNIMQTSDFHFNMLNDKDKKENNPCINATRKVRMSYRDESTVGPAKKALGYADKFDAVAITGDNIDYLTWGSLELLKTNVWDVLGDKVIMSLGGHDTVRLMETSSPNDSTTLDSRYQILQNAWKHDIQYSNKIINDRVMMVQINNGQSKYYAEQVEKFKKDIEKARKENLVILLFQHEPISTGNVKHSKIYSLTGEDNFNYYKNGVGGSKYDSDKASADMYKLITENADVIKGIFCGHMHYDYYIEVSATYQKDGKTVETVIPQVVLAHIATDVGGIMNVIMVD